MAQRSTWASMSVDARLQPVCVKTGQAAAARAAGRPVRKFTNACCSEVNSSCACFVGIGGE